MDSGYLSVAVVMSAGGAVLDACALEDIPSSQVLEADFAVATLASCATLRLAHTCSQETLRGDLQVWAAARGWSVAVAPVPGSG